MIFKSLGSIAHNCLIYYIYDKIFSSYPLWGPSEGLLQIKKRSCHNADKTIVVLSDNVSIIFFSNQTIIYYKLVNNDYPKRSVPVKIMAKNPTGFDALLLNTERAPYEQTIINSNIS